jgi:hypothetical protein
LATDNIGETRLISVGADDERKFTEKEWAEILTQVENGSVLWED